MRNEQIDLFNAFVKEEHHYELHVYSFSPTKLVLAGNHELDYGHTTELHFSDVDFYCGRKSFVLDEPSDAPLELVTEKPDYIELSTKYAIESGNELFSFATDSGVVIIAAKKMIFVKRTVLYYKPENLEQNQEIAYWLEEH